MKRVGVAGVSLGFVVGSLACTLDPHHIHWGLFALGLGLGLAGVAVLRHTRRAQESGSVADQNLSTISASLKRIATNVENLNQSKTTMNVYDLPAKIDATFPDDLEIFVDGRKSIAARFGIDAYAEVMTEFAAAERYLNRVWSASVDGYQDEAHTYLGRASEQFRRALEALTRMQPSPTA